jgi:23S rRNA pseudouridine1911/1915/1917 synthase
LKRGLDIIYEDNHVLAVNKPPGLLTQPSGTSQESLESFCKAYIKEKYGKPGNVFLEAIHRLDKPVSGIVVFARTSKALSRLQASMRNKSCVKRYQALIVNAPFPEEGILEHYLMHDDHKAAVVDSTHPQAKLARLSYRVIQRQGPYILIELELETGRYHQIRAQLAAIGCPIIGDDKYGSQVRLAENRLALHHVYMQIQHPISGHDLKLEFGHNLAAGHPPSFISA